MNNEAFASIKEFWKRFKLPTILFVFGILIIILSERSSYVEKNDTSATDKITSEDAEIYTEHLEKKIKALLSELEGVSDVSVLLTLDGGNELVYAENTSSGTVDYLIINSSDGEEPVLIRKIYSSVRGIAVVCKGGDSANIRRTITELLSSAFDLPYTKISVAGAE